MIRHILKIIWNERRVNLWIMLEYIVVFCVLWFCCDFLYSIAKSYLEYPGFDASHTYIIKVGKKDIQPATDEDPAGYVSVFTERVKRFPGVESISFSEYAIPYAKYKNAMGGITGKDSTHVMTWYKVVTPSFFDVYRMKLESGRALNENDMITQNAFVISPDRDGQMGIFGSGPVDANEMTSMKVGNKVWDVVGRYARTKSYFYEAFASTTYGLYAPGQIDLSAVDISIRVRPEEDDKFADKFMEQMREQLFIGPYFLVNITPSEELEKAQVDSDIGDNLNSVLAVTAFLLLNIFLALIGTFWFRTQSRRSEIGLRIAMGASKRNVQTMMFTETIIMLFIASVLSTYICINLAGTEILQSLGIPLADRGAAGMGSGQDVINFLITFGFIAIVSCLAVWYPARQSSNIAPAEALRDE